MGAKRFDFISNNREVEALNPGNGNCAIEQGATFTFSMTVYAPAGTILDLTGYAARMSIRKVVGQTAVIDELTSASEITLNAANSPNLTVEIAASVTAAYDWSGLAYYDLEIDDQDISVPTVTRLLYGQIELLKEVTT